VFHPGEINYWAVLVAALATFLLGGLWYTALFGKTWVKLHGYGDEQVKKMQARRPPYVFFPSMIACYLVLAFVIALAADRLHEAGRPRRRALFGGLVWLGPVACIGMTNHISVDEPFGIYLINKS